MKLYVLREVWTETYDCPDYGMTNICDTYADIHLSQNESRLTAMADNLNSGFPAGRWSEKRAKELRALYQQYDSFRESRFVVLDISSLLLPEVQS